VFNEGSDKANAVRDKFETFFSDSDEDWRNRAYILVLFVFGAYVFLDGLGELPLYGWDESVYAEAALHMVNSGKWVIPQIEGGHGVLELHPYIRKPPLAIWGQALSMHIIGINEFAARLPSAIAGLLTSIVVYLMGRDMFDKLTGFVAATVFLSIPYTYYGFNMVRHASTDSLFVLFGTLATYSAYKVYDGFPKYMYLGGLTASLAFLSKGFALGIYAIIGLPLIFLAWRNYMSKELVKTGLISALISLPWMIYTYSVFGYEFIDRFLVEGIIERASETSSMFADQTMFEFMKYPYFQDLTAMGDPWIYFAVPAAILMFHDNRDKLSKPVFLSWWTVSTLIFFSVVGSRAWYIFPLMVPISIFVGYLIREFSKAEFKPVLVYSFSLLLSFSLSIRMIEISPYSLEPVSFYTVPLDPMIFVGTMMFFTASLLLSHFVNLDYSFELEDIVIPAASIIMMFMLLGAPTFDKYSISVESNEQSKKFAMQLNEEIPQNETLYVSENAVEDPMTDLAFYLQPSLSSIDSKNISSEEYILTTLEQDFENYSVIRNDTVLEWKLNQRVKE